MIFHFEMFILFSTAILMLYNIKQKDKIGMKGFNCSEEKIICFSFLWEDSRVLAFLVSVDDVVKCYGLGCLWELQVTPVLAAV